MAEINLGRVQGGSIFYTASAISSNACYKEDLIPTNINPLVGDTILSSTGQLYSIDSINDNTITLTAKASLKGMTGAAGYTIWLATITSTDSMTVSQLDPNQSPSSLLHSPQVGDTVLFTDGVMRTILSKSSASLGGNTTGDTLRLSEPTTSLKGEPGPAGGAASFSLEGSVLTILLS